MLHAFIAVNTLLEGGLRATPNGLARPAFDPMARARLPRVVAQDDVWDEEIDAADTLSDWEAELAASKAWEQSRASKAPAEATEWNGEVDEEAYFDVDMDDADLGDSDWRDARRAAPLPADENSVARRLRLLAEERSGAPPPVAGIPSAVQSSDGPSNAQVMTSLSAVLAGLARLEEKVDALGARLDGLQRAGSSTPAAPMAAPSPPSPPPPPPAAPVAPSPPPASTPAAPPSTKVECGTARSTRKPTLTWMRKTPISAIGATSGASTGSSRRMRTELSGTRVSRADPNALS